ncbi:hypothetical protein C0Q70_14145 [Pomacea canaliculata]|uniref:Uncharacterized protein n=1 Tax=Pomacea canaliculata TaxID=400727 RepID=A0A2T7NZ86_POMCA|nr:hypothetical protein C0Q70_14145 [Pomacea canaliculata]
MQLTARPPLASHWLLFLSREYVIIKLQHAGDQLTRRHSEADCTSADNKLHVGRDYVCQTLTGFSGTKISFECGEGILPPSGSRHRYDQHYQYSGYDASWMDMINMSGVVDDLSPLFIDQQPSRVSVDDGVINGVAASVNNDAVSRIPKTALEISFDEDFPEHSVPAEDNVNDYVTSPEPQLHDLLPTRCVPFSYNQSSSVGVNMQRVNVSAGTSGGGSVEFNNLEVRPRGCPGVTRRTATASLPRQNPRRRPDGGRRLRGAGDGGTDPSHQGGAQVHDPEQTAGSGQAGAHGRPDPDYPEETSPGKSSGTFLTSRNL